MAFPLVPILAVIAIAGGASTAIWYYRLSEEDREKADERAIELAKELFNKTIEELTKKEAKQIRDQVKDESAN